jgi:hypothetical protein
MLQSGVKQPDTVTNYAQNFGMVGGASGMGLAPRTFMSPSTSQTPFQNIPVRLGAMQASGAPSMTGNVPVTYPVRIRARPDQSDDLYMEGDLLFARTEPHSREEQSNLVTTLWSMNTYAEKRHREKLAELAEPDLGNKKRNRFRSALTRNDVDDVIRDFPNTPSQFTQNWNFIGVLSADARTSTTGKRMITAIVGNRARVANIWGDVSSGDTVGFIVKKCNLGYKRCYGMTYAKGGDPSPTQGEYLCIIPYASSHGPPAFCSEPLDPGFYDRCYYDTEDVEVVTYEEDASRNIKLDSPDQRVAVQKVTVRTMVEGAWIKIGKVLSRGNGKLPYDEERLLAIRTQDGYKDLINKNAVVEISIDTSV